MHVITRKRLNEFAERHPVAKSPLQNWYTRMKGGRFRSFSELRAVFPDADQVDGLTVFDVGRRARLITAIHYNRQKVYIRAVLTHGEYDKGEWRR